MNHDLLPPGDLEVLEFERAWPVPSGPKDKAILERFHHNVTRYYQRLHHIVDQPAAEVYDAMLVRRLRRLRDDKRAARSTRRQGFEVAR